MSAGDVHGWGISALCVCYLLYGIYVGWFITMWVEYGPPTCWKATPKADPFSEGDQAICLATGRIAVYRDGKFRETPSPPSDAKDTKDTKDTKEDV